MLVCLERVNNTAGTEPADSNYWGKEERRKEKELGAKLTAELYEEH